MDDDLDNFIDSRCDSRSLNIHVDADIVFSVLCGMDLGKGSGHNNVASIFLRNCADLLCQPLSDIFKCSLATRVFPEPFKISVVTPIFKSGKKSSVTNYRGVNVPPNLTEVFERIVYNQMKLVVFPKISKSQHGFVSNRNIEINLNDAFEIRAQLDVFYADIGKAFDSVNTDLLIRKLAKFPISNNMLLWFKSYFEDRKQYIRIGSSKSSLFNFTSGVGHGTILGPLLFITFFNDSDIISLDVLSSNFADDKRIAVIIRNKNDVHKLQSAIDNLLIWCDQNGLQINMSKC